MTRKDIRRDLGSPCASATTRRRDSGEEFSKLPDRERRVLPLSWWSFGGRLRYELPPGANIERGDLLDRFGRVCGTPGHGRSQKCEPLPPVRRRGRQGFWYLIGLS